MNNSKPKSMARIGDKIRITGLPKAATNRQDLLDTEQTIFDVEPGRVGDRNCTVVFIRGYAFPFSEDMFEFI